MPTAVPPAKVLLASAPVAYQILKNPPPFYELDGSGGRAGLSVAVFSAADAVTFSDWAAGLPTLIDMGGGLTATRYIPLSDPFTQKLVCTSVRGKWTGEYTSGNADPLKQWSAAKIDLEFGTVPYSTDGGSPFMTVEFEEGVEVYTIGGAKYSFASGEPIQADAGVKVPISVYSLSIYQAVGANDAVMQPLLGKLNNAVFQGKAVGTVRFDGFSVSVTMLSSGQTAYKRTLKLSWRPIHWNYFLDRTATWGLVTDPGGGTVYQLADLSPLLN